MEQEVTKTGSEQAKMAERAHIMTCMHALFSVGVSSSRHHLLWKPIGAAASCATWRAHAQC